VRVHASPILKHTVFDKCFVAAAAAAAAAAATVGHGN